MSMILPYDLPMNGVRTLVVIGTYNTGSCKSNYPFMGRSYGKIMLIILFMRYEYSWRRGTTWHFFSATLGRISFFLETFA
jgi:hypothetical protein